MGYTLKVRVLGRSRGSAVRGIRGRGNDRSTDKGTEVGVGVGICAGAGHVTKRGGLHYS